MRDQQPPGGYHWLNGEQLGRVKLGNAMASAACRPFKIAVLAGSRVILEQPTTSLMWSFQAFEELHNEVKGLFGNRGVCLDGAPWRNPIPFYLNAKAIKTISGTCNCTAKHIALVGERGETI